jgi:hypothetical protein
MTTDQNQQTAAEESFSAFDSGENQNESASDARNAASQTSGSQDGNGEKSVLAQKDQTITQLRQQLSRNALQAQIDRIETEAATESSADITAVSDGEMTAETAQTRADDRRNATRTKVEDVSNQIPEQERIAAQLVNDALVAREGFAIRLSKEFDVDMEVLMDDQTLTNPDEMRIKARELQLDARDSNRTGSQVFDSGQKRAASLNVNEMDAMSKVRAGL